MSESATIQASSRSRSQGRFSGPIPIEAVTVRGSEFSNVAFRVAFNSGVLREIFLRSASVRVYGDSADKALIFCEAFAQNDHSLRRDLIFANILGVISTPVSYTHLQAMVLLVKHGCSATATIIKARLSMDRLRAEPSVI